MSEQNEAAVGNGTGAEEIFLSPRVVDRQAFNDFAAQLRVLIDEAGAQAEALRAAATEAHRTRDGLREATNANQMKLEMATRALATIDQKTEQTRRMIEGAADVGVRMDELRAKADAIITEHTGILCQRINEAEAGALAQADQAQGQLTAITQRAEQSAAALAAATTQAAGPLVAQLTDLVSRAEAGVHGTGGLATLVTRAESASQAATHALGELAEIRKQADQARQLLGDSLNAAAPTIDEVGTIQGHLETTITQAVKLCQDAQRSISEHVANERRALDLDLARLAPAAQSAKTELAAIVQAAETAARSAAQAAAGAECAGSGLATLLAQVEPWRRVILGDTAGGAPVGAALNGVMVELKKELRGVAGALRAIAERTEAALEPETSARPAPLAAVPSPTRPVTTLLGIEAAA